MPGQYNLSVLFFNQQISPSGSFVHSLYIRSVFAQDRLAEAAAVTVGGIMGKCRFFLHKPMS